MSEEIEDAVIKGEKVRILADDQELFIESKPMMVLVGQGEINIEVPSHVLVDPETTIACAKEISQEEWVEIRVNENFLAKWKLMWLEVEPPLILAKASLASRATVGMILLIFKAFGEKRHIHLKYPETYQHPKQCANMMTMLNSFQGK